MKLDMSFEQLKNMNYEQVKDFENVKLLLDALKILNIDSKGNEYSLFIRLGFLVKHFEHQISDLKDEIESLKRNNKELKNYNKFLKRKEKNEQSKI